MLTHCYPLKYFEEFFFTVLAFFAPRADNHYLIKLFVIILAVCSDPGGHTVLLT